MHDSVHMHAQSFTCATTACNLCKTSFPRVITAPPQSTDLAHGVGAEVDGRNLVQLINCTLVDVGQLHAATAQAALTRRPLYASAQSKKQSMASEAHVCVVINNFAT